MGIINVRSLFSPRASRMNTQPSVKKSHMGPSRVARAAVCLMLTSLEANTLALSPNRVGPPDRVPKELAQNMLRAARIGCLKSIMLGYKSARRTSSEN